MKSLKTVFGFICLKNTLGPNTHFQTWSIWLLSEDFLSSDTTIAMYHYYLAKAQCAKTQLCHNFGGGPIRVFQFN